MPLYYLCAHLQRTSSFLLSMTMSFVCFAWTIALLAMAQRHRVKFFVHRCDSLPNFGMAKGYGGDRIHQLSAEPLQGTHHPQFSYLAESAMGLPWDSLLLWQQSPCTEDQRSPHPVSEDPFLLVRAAGRLSLTLGPFLFTGRCRICAYRSSARSRHPWNG